MSIMLQPNVRSPTSGLHSPPDSNTQKNVSSDSELSDIEVESDLCFEEDIKIEPSSIIDGVPVFTPNMEQFKDFEKFITAVNPWGMTHGIAKVIPPKEWLDEQPPLHEEVKKIKIKNPYIQEMNNQGSRGSTGNFRQLNLSSNRTYNIVEWRSLCNQLNRQPPAKRGERRKAPDKPTNISRKKADLSRSTNDAETHPPGTKGRVVSAKKSKQKEEEVSVNSRRNKYKEDDGVIDDEAFKDFDYNLYEEFDDERCQDLEVAYWKHISYAPPIYGGDMPGTLFTDKTKVWDLRNLPGFLNYLDEKVPGINTTYLYVGSWKSTFSWHLEDVDLYSINYLHFGAPKQWYSISQGDRDRFEKAMSCKWPEEFKDCDQFLRHKTFQISPAALWKEFKIKVNKMVHRPGEFMITFPYGYHAGYNLGYNCAEAVNFAVDEWIPIAEKAKRCECAQQQDSVWVDLNSIRKSLPPNHKWYLPSNDEEYFDDFEGGNQPIEMPTPPHSGSEVKTSLPRKRKPNVAKDENITVKRRIILRLSEEPPCLLCPNSEYELLQTENGKRAHRICGEYIPETSVSNGIVQDINFISKARMGLKCIYCRSKRGACFQCSAAKCTRAYHATCAASAGVLVQKVWVTSFGQDGTEYKEEVYDFRCRFHRPKRDKKLEESSLSDDVRARQYGSKLKVGEICQAQLLFSEIFAGLILSNNYSECSLILRILFDHTNTQYEIDYKWLLVPPEQSSLPKPSANAVPMPKSFKAKESLNTRARQLNDLPRAHDPFCDNHIWAEFNTHVIDRNLDQAKVDLEKEYQIWHYLGKHSTEARAQFTDDLSKPWDNPKSNFLSTLPKPAFAISKQSCHASHSSSRLNKPNLTPRSTLSSPAIISNTSNSENPRISSTKSLKGPRQVSQSPQKFSAENSQLSQGMLMKKQFGSTHPSGTDPQFSSGMQVSNNKPSVPSTKNPKCHRLSEEYLVSSTPQNQTGSSNLLLTQPSWPSIDSKPLNVNVSSHKPVATEGCTPLPGKVSSCHEQHHSHSLKLKASVPKSALESNLSAKYKYLQIEYNKDARCYKTPYRVGGGFMNGYEGSLDNLKRYCEIVGLKNLALPSPSSSPTINSSLQSPNPLHPAIKQRYQHHQSVKPKPPSSSLGKNLNNEETSQESKTRSIQSSSSCLSSENDVQNKNKNMNLEALSPDKSSEDNVSLEDSTLATVGNKSNQINNKTDAKPIYTEPSRHNLNPTLNRTNITSEQTTKSLVRPQEQVQDRPTVRVFPDVPPDTVTLIERMMSNLRKAADLNTVVS
ncbi:hypothetical protein K3495_g341 [Podosphaera aphanis]|nr:hypothetical protein K3495_g341 [Podosphaera aphanis]